MAFVTPAKGRSIGRCRLSVGLLSIFLASLFSISYTAAAAPATQSRAAAVVRGWLKADARPLGEFIPKQIQRVEVIANATGETLGFVVHLQPAGFVLVSADDAIEPVIAFSSGGTLELSAANPLGALVLGDLPNRLAWARRVGDTEPLVIESRKKWNRLKLADQSPVLNSSGVTPSDIRIAPLTQSRWSQSTVNGLACYNYFTPPYAAGNAQNDVSGCVATAIAQLMRYYQFPTTSVGTASFSISVDGTATTAQLRGGDGAGSPYSWANMPNVPSSPTATQCQAIGALLYDSGIASKMSYTSSSSAASLSTARSALQNVFHYPSAIYTYSSAGFGSNLLAMINPNLDARRPVIIGITGSPGGHAVVCDGYGYNSATLYHHINMGWAGTDTAWYALPTIPTTLGTFTSVQDCIYNVFTNASGEIISGRVVDISGVPVSGATVTARATSTYSSTTDANGIYALVQLPSKTSYSLTVSKTGYATSSATASTRTSANNGSQSGNVWGIDFRLGATPVSLTLTASPVQGGTMVGSGAFAPGVQTQISATAANGWSFYQWQDGVKLNPRAITIPASNVAYTASFIQPPTLTTSILTNSNISLAIQCTPGASNRIEYSTNLVQWWALASNLANLNGTIYFTDKSASNAPRRFYRVVVP